MDTYPIPHKKRGLVKFWLGNFFETGDYLSDPGLSQYVLNIEPNYRM